jgi:hypothetical protein
MAAQGKVCALTPVATKKPLTQHLLQVNLVQKGALKAL